MHLRSIAACLLLPLEESPFQAVLPVTSTLVVPVPVISYTLIVRVCLYCARAYSDSTRLFVPRSTTSVATIPSPTLARRRQPISKSLSPRSISPSSVVPAAPVDDADAVEDLVLDSECRRGTTLIHHNTRAVAQLAAHRRLAAARNARPTCVYARQFPKRSVFRSRQPAADPQGSPVGSRYDWLACCTPLGCRRCGRSFAILSKWRRRLND